MRKSLAAATIVSLSLIGACERRMMSTRPTPVESFAPPQAAMAIAQPDVGEVPFKGRFEGSLTMSIPNPPLLSNLIEGSGNATQLGRFTIRMPHVVNTITRIGTGTYEFTAANGDTLIAEFTGQAAPTAPGVLTVLDTATITGGTGRFVNATGSFRGTRIFTIATAEITTTFEGTISSAGANLH